MEANTSFVEMNPCQHKQSGRVVENKHLTQIASTRSNARIGRKFKETTLATFYISCVVETRYKVAAHVMETSTMRSGLRQVPMTPFQLFSSASVHNRVPFKRNTVVSLSILRSRSEHSPNAPKSVSFLRLTNRVPWLK